MPQHGGAEPSGRHAVALARVDVELVEDVVGLVPPACEEEARAQRTAQGRGGWRRGCSCSEPVRTRGSPGTRTLGGGALGVDVRREDAVVVEVIVVVARLLRGVLRGGASVSARSACTEPQRGAPGHPAGFGRLRWRGLPALVTVISSSHLTMRPPIQPGMMTRMGKPWSGSSGSKFCPWWRAGRGRGIVRRAGGRVSAGRRPQARCGGGAEGARAWAPHCGEQQTRLLIGEHDVAGGVERHVHRDGGAVGAVGALGELAWGGGGGERAVKWCCAEAAWRSRRGGPAHPWGRGSTRTGPPPKARRCRRRSGCGTGARPSSGRC